MNAQDYVNGDITKYWDDRHAQWARYPDVAHFKMKDQWFEVRYAHIVPCPIYPEDGAVLDFGCGCGQYSVPLARRYTTYVGVDTSPAAIKLCYNYFDEPGKTFFLLPANTVELPFPDNHFDLVNTITVLQHLPFLQRLQAIRELKRVLKPGGKYIGLEMMGNTMAADMPPMRIEDWLEAWKPLIMVHDVPAHHPEWALDNIWYST